MAVLYLLLSEAMYNPSTQPAAEPPPPYGHALMGVRVLKFDGAIAPRVLKFDSGSAAEGCGGRHMDKPCGREG